MTTCDLEDVIAPWNEALRVPEMLPFIRSGQKLLQANVALQAHSARILMRYQLEGLSFLGRRLEADLKLVETLIASGEFVDAFDVVGNFVQNSTAAYADEIGKVASIGASFAAEAAGHLRKEARNTIEDMAAATATA
ncbi:hypothetical protein MesoLj113a_64180 [Mesorhizobium sp. 113-1-2]|jgi:hypothetical protein|nr:hypothetical protein MLTONO_6160 [Mesorhizobium loti]BCG75260.1 hypothetical protein MesoLj113a_64180 [Mesorhizobium sp. 113-1-2]